MPNHEGPHEEGFPCWVDLSVHDVDSAVAFYEHVLGWKFAETAAEYGGYRMASRDGSYAAGIGPQQGDNPSYWVVYFAVESADRVAERAKELGGSVYVEPFDVSTQGRMAIISDPTGAMFGVWEAQEHHGFQVSEQLGFYTWAEVNTSDADKARDFYTQLFGATHSETPNPATTYYVLAKGGHNIGGVLQMNDQWEGIPPHWMVYFGVDDIDAAVARAKEKGGTVAVEPFDTGYGRIAVIGDPAMAPFSLMQR